MRYTFIIVLALFVTSSTCAQNEVEKVLTAIAKNNKSIIANQQYWEAKKLQYKTGLNPENPKFEYEYLAGTTPNGSDQIDYFIVQSFDFPTSYIKKNQVAKRQIEQSDFEVAAYRQDILLKAKQICLELIYLNKKQIGLKQQVEFINKIYGAHKLKLEKGDASVLDLNKIKLQAFNWENELRLTMVEIKNNMQKLVELNGGIEIEFTSIDYPIFENIPELTTLQKDIEANDPNLKSIHQQNEIDQKKLELSRAMAMPKLEGGFRSQEFAGQRIQGVHLGITIPLWENKNKVKHRKAHLRFNDLEIEEHHNEHHHEIHQLYEKYSSLAVSLEEYEKLMNDVKSNELLEKALVLGEISFIQYILEINYFYDAYNKYLSLERDYHLVIAELYKYRL